ncbi:MAG TPA: hypothetical protein VK492_07630 [Chitinophagaceae bacterium]|nr:hypothetical protein [Chitinophagaceae bacterium]
MDKDRQIRFLYPPLIFLGSLALGFYLDKSVTIKSIVTAFPDIDKSLNVVLAILGAGSLILLLGYLLGTITVFLLKLAFKIKGKSYNYEELLSDRYYAAIGNIILNEKDKPLKREDTLYAVCTFDHGFISPGVHQWIVRRWNAFFISLSSTVAIFSSFLVGLFFVNLKFHWLWLTASFVFILILGWLASTSWYETMRMIEFQTRVKRSEERGKNSGQ